MKKTIGRQLIVNADDFGLHSAVNRAIIKGHVAGCITSASLMTGGAAFSEAVALASGHPSLGVGVHLTLVGEKPVLDPARIPSLVDGEGRFPAQYPQFILRYMRRRINLTEVQEELAAQLDKAVSCGVAVTHLDSHQHLHVLPGIIDIVLAIAAKYNVKAVRIPAEPLLFTGGHPFTLGRITGRTGLSLVAVAARRKAQRLKFSVPDHFFGMLAGGNMQAEYLLNIINRLPIGVSEIMVHPGDDEAALTDAYGWPYHWQAELAAVTSARVLDRISELKIKLVSFRELENG